MRAGDFLRAVEDFPVGTVEDLTAGEPFVIVAPHPDDETLGCAGLMMQAGDLGIPFHIVVATDGGASHPNSTTYPPARLSALRRSESIAAAAACGVPEQRVRCLGLRDSEVPLSGDPFESACDAIAAVVDEIGARSVFVTWRHDPHCDHEAVHDIAQAVSQRHRLRLWCYPIWGWTLPAENDLAVPEPRGLRLDIAPWRARKIGAVACHRSQTTQLIDDDPDGFVLDPQMLVRFQGDYEYFIRGAA